MDLSSRFKEEVKKAVELMELEPARPLPSKVLMEDFEPKPGRRWGVQFRGKAIVISSKLKEKVGAVLKREALISLIPVEADEVPEVFDLAWAYSGLEEEWRTVCLDALTPWDYDPMKLLSGVPRKKKLSLIRDVLWVVRLLAEQGRLDFDTFFYHLRKIASPLFKPRESEKKVIEVLKRNPYLSQKEISKKASISQSSVSKAIDRLRTFGYIIGPANFNPNRLGLMTLVLAFPNRWKLIRVFKKFPFTYRIFEPVSKGVRALAILTVPYESSSRLDELRELGIEVSQMVMHKYVLKLDPPSDATFSIMKAWRKRYPVQKSSPRYERPKERLTREDIAFLNQIRAGGVKEEHVHKYRYRKDKLKKAGVLEYYFTLASPASEDDLMVRAKVREEDFLRLVKTIGSSATVSGAYLKGDWEGFLGLVNPSRGLTGEICRALRLILEEGVEVCTGYVEHMFFKPLPVELWDEGRQTFLWEEEFSRLVSNIRYL